MEKKAKTQKRRHYVGISNVSPELYDALCRLARKEGRSIAAQMRHMLAQQIRVAVAVGAVFIAA